MNKATLRPYFLVEVALSKVRHRRFAAGDRVVTGDRPSPRNMGVGERVFFSAQASTANEFIPVEIMNGIRQAGRPSDTNRHGTLGVSHGG